MEPGLVVDRMRSTRPRALATKRRRAWTIAPPEDGEPDLSYGEELLWRRSLHEL